MWLLDLPNIGRSSVCNLLSQQTVLIYHFWRRKRSLSSSTVLKAVLINMFIG